MARLVVLIVFFSLLVGGRSAEAHAVLVDTVPDDGAVLREAPRQVVLRFSEPVAPVMLRVLDIDARPIADASQARVENETPVFDQPAETARPPLHRQAAMRPWSQVELPGTDEAARTHLAIPMSPVLTREQADAVVAAVRDADLG